MTFTSAFDFIRSLYGDRDFIPLHEPQFMGNEKVYLNQCIDSGFVSSVGEFVNEFEEKIAKFCGANYAVATTNGTSALHATLYALGINSDCEVLTQSLSFIATSNAIAYTGAKPVYIDVDLDSLSLSPQKLLDFLQSHATYKNGQTINKITGKILKACVPMHTFGFLARTEEIKKICDEWGILLIEDAAESLGSYHIRNGEKIHSGLDGIASTLSFNGNKTITCGGGGAILTNNEELARKLKHITTTAKIPHPYKYNHDMLGFNYRLPNLNAALAVAQIEQLPKFLANKSKTAQAYSEFFQNSFIDYINARKGTSPNFWLNTIMFKDKSQRDDFLMQSNQEGIMTRPIWKLNHQCNAFLNCQCDDLSNSIYLQDRVVNIPSSVKGKTNEN